MQLGLLFDTIGHLIHFLWYIKHYLEIRMQNYLRKLNIIERIWWFRRRKDMWQICDDYIYGFDFICLVCSNNKVKCDDDRNEWMLRQSSKKFKIRLFKCLFSIAIYCDFEFRDYWVCWLIFRFIGLVEDHFSFFYSIYTSLKYSFFFYFFVVTF